MNTPSKLERLAMQQRYAAPKPPITGYHLIQSGRVIYESRDPKLCHWFKKENNLVNAKVFAKR